MMLSRRSEVDLLKRSIHGFLRTSFQAAHKSIAARQLRSEKLMKISTTYLLRYTAHFLFGKGLSSTGSKKNSLI